MATGDDLNLDLLARLCAIPGIPGREDAVREVMRAELAPLVDALRVDALGNLIGVRRGAGGPRVMVAAHMDEIGFLVKHVDDRGFIRLHPAGGFDPSRLPAQRVLVHASDGRMFPGSIGVSGKPIHLLAPHEVKPVTVDDLFVDIGLGGDAARAAITVGDMVTLERDFQRAGDTVMTRALDDRAGLFAMLEALRRLDGAQTCEIVAVATVQEEVGTRGALTAARAVQPDIGLVLDISPAGDFPGAPEEHVGIRLGGGVAIKVMDTASISDRRCLALLRCLADQHGIPYQQEILPRGGTDAGAMQRVHRGVAVATLSLPVRYAHTVNETCALADLSATVELTTHFLRRAHEIDLSG